MQILCPSREFRVIVDLLFAFGTRSTDGDAHSNCPDEDLV